jgi:hypothetical protein
MSSFLSSIFKSSPKLDSLDSIIGKSTKLISSIEPELLKFLKYYHIYLYIYDVVASKEENLRGVYYIKSIKGLENIKEYQQINEIEFADEITEITIGTNAIKIPTSPYNPSVISISLSYDDIILRNNIHVHIHNLLVRSINNYRQLYSSKHDMINKLKSEIKALISEMYRLTNGKVEDEKKLKVVAFRIILESFVKGLDNIVSNFILVEIDYYIPTLSASIIETPKSNVSIEDTEKSLKAFLLYETNNDKFVTYIRLHKADILSIFNRYIEQIRTIDENKRKVLGLLLKYEHILKESTGGTGGNSNTEPIKTAKKQILGKERCIYKKTGDRKEYVKHKGNLITVKDYRTLMKKKASSTI